MQYAQLFSCAEVKNTRKPQYGYGIIDKIENGIITVYYENRGDVNYQFPKCFLEGYIELVDPTLEDIIMDLLVEEERNFNLQKQQEKQLRHGREEPKVHILKYGQTFKTHAEILNDCFSQNKIFFRFGGYIVDNRTIVWFPKECEYNPYNKSYIPCSDTGWINIFEDNRIIEHNNINEANEKYYDNDMNRLVFAKYLNKYEYTYIGVYRMCSKDLSICTNTHHEFIKVTNDFNLFTMEPIYKK